MKKRSFFKKLGYWFDCLMAKGTLALTALLFLTMLVIVVIIGVLAVLVTEDGGLAYYVWASLMHTLDTGALGGNSTDNVLYLLLMSVATLCGLFITSILIGIIATGFENKLNDLRKGTSVVQEKKHTVIVGFNDNVFTILQELIKANENQKKSCIVVLGEISKEKMEAAISAHIPNPGRTRIICRSGKYCEEYSLKRCAVECAHSVVVNLHADAEIVKTILALSSYLKGKELTCPDLHFIVSPQNSRFVEAAVIAGEGRTTVIYAKDAIARIIANTCRQHGLSQVLTEIFNFGSNELYFESIPEMEGRTIREALLSFSNAVVVGLYTNGRTLLNPPMDTVIGKNDQLVLLEEDDGSFKAHPVKSTEAIPMQDTSGSDAKENNDLLILGSNDKLPIILKEYDLYVAAGTQVTIVDDDFDTERLPPLANLKISICKQAVSHDFLYTFLQDSTKNILLLNDDSIPPEQSDAQTLLNLILLRDIADKTNRHFSITTEMQNVDNQRLAAQARVDDFVIGSNFVSLLMAQLSENYNLAPLVEDLLDESGSELYMKPASRYVPPGKPVDFYTITASAAERGEICIGYRLTPTSDVVVNPDKTKIITCNEDSLVVVIAQN